MDFLKKYSKKIQNLKLLHTLSKFFLSSLNKDLLNFFVAKVFIFTIDKSVVKELKTRQDK